MRLDLLSSPKVSQVVTEVQRCIAAVASEHGCGKTGGYLYLRDPKEDIGICLPVGTLDTFEWLNREKYRALAREKAERLARYPQHVLSWQSRDAPRAMWGGAVRTPHMLLSFSGLPEAIDEAFMLAVAQRVGLLKLGESHRFAQLSSNEHLGPVLKSMY